MALDWNDDALARGLACYRAEEFFEAHEHWELVWLKCAEPDKTFLQSLIQISAAFHHFRRGNCAGAASLLRRALEKLKPYPAEYAEIDVARLRADMAAWIAALANEAAPPSRRPLIR